MSYRPKRYKDLTEDQKAALEEIRHRHKEEHDALSNSFYQKKHGAGVSPEEQAAFDVQHNAIHQKYEQEMLQAGLLEEYDELEVTTTRLNELLVDVNKLREQRELKALEIIEKG
jgi:hypothetical protein